MSLAKSCLVGEVCGGGGGGGGVVELTDPTGDAVAVGSVALVELTGDGATVTLPEVDGEVTILASGSAGKSVGLALGGTDTSEPGLKVTVGQSKTLVGTTGGGVRNWAPVPGPGSWEYGCVKFDDLDSQELNATDAEQTLSNGLKITVERRGNHGTDDIDIVNGQGLKLTSPQSVMHQYAVFPLSQLFTDTSYREHARWRITFVLDLANTVFSGSGRKFSLGIGGRADWDDATNSVAFRAHVDGTSFFAKVWHDTTVDHVYGTHDGVKHEFTLCEYDPLRGSFRAATGDAASVPARISEIDTLVGLIVAHAEARSWDGVLAPADPIQAATEQQDAYAYFRVGGSSDVLVVKEVHVWRERPEYDPMYEA